MNKKCFIALQKYWIVVMFIAAAVLSFMSFFMPYSDIGDYTIAHIIKFEAKFILLAFIIFFSVGFIISVPFTLIDVFFLASFPKRFPRGVLKTFFVILNGFLILIPFIIWECTRYEVNQMYAEVVLPVYMVTSMVTAILVIKTKTFVPCFQKQQPSKNI